MDDSKFFIIGANGQLGTALREQYPNVKFADQAELDITNHQSVELFDWSGISIVLNAAAFTNVDGAETPEGRVAAWKNGLRMVPSGVSSKSLTSFSITGQISHN